MRKYVLCDLYIVIYRIFFVVLKKVDGRCRCFFCDTKTCCIGL